MCSPLFFFFFFFNDTATTEIYTLSLHDALPISHQVEHAPVGGSPAWYRTPGGRSIAPFVYDGAISHDVAFGPLLKDARSEEHTSELQSQSNLVCRLLLEKKKTKETQTVIYSMRV